MKFSLFDAMIDQTYGVSVYGFDNDFEKNSFAVDSGIWCEQTFGKSPVGRWSIPKWKQSFTTFYFREEKQRTLFLLRWS